MKNCYKCKMLKINYGKLDDDGYNDWDYRFFQCGRNCGRTFNNPELHGWFCRHYVGEVIKNGSK